MIRRLASLCVQSLALVLLLCIASVAQSQDRGKIERDIETLREQLKQRELEFLSPSPADSAQFVEFLGQRDTGLARLLPREKYGEKLTVRGGGSYYSFTRQSNSYDSNPQIGLERDNLYTGFSGADFGFLTSLGEIPLESVGLDHESVKYLAEFAAPTLEPEAREQYRRSSAGFEIGRTRYKARLPVIVGGTYILRSLSYDRFDVLVAFRVVRQNTDGSLIILWKKLREFSTPYLTRS